MNPKLKGFSEQILIIILILYFAICMIAAFINRIVALEVEYAFRKPSIKLFLLNSLVFLGISRKYNIIFSF